MAPRRTGSMQVHVQSRKGKDMGSFMLDESATLVNLKEAFAAKYAKYNVNRQWFTLDSKQGERIVRTAIKDGKPLSDFGVGDNTTLTFKDLGPQIAWRTVFLVEYFGPILMHAVCFLLPTLVYGASYKQPTGVARLHQQIAFALVCIHYIKREFETMFVHRFSNSTMPAFNIFKNSFHYWILGGLLIAYWLYHPLYTPPAWATQPLTRNVCIALFLLAELGNLSAHVTLRNLRPPGTKKRGIPRGGMFELVTCANYTYELTAWLVFAIWTQVATAYFFFVVSFVQIALWSLKKHGLMKKEFKGKAPKRKILVPFIW